jgi:hypothetical protein
MGFTLVMLTVSIWYFIEFLDTTNPKIINSLVPNEEYWATNISNYDLEFAFYIAVGDESNVIPPGYLAPFGELKAMTYKRTRTLDAAGNPIWKQDIVWMDFDQCLKNPSVLKKFF